MAELQIEAPERARGRRAQNKAELAGRILAAARDAFVADGVNDADLADIARKAKVGRATLYRYFDGKDALLKALLDEDWDAQAGLFRRLAQAAVIDGPTVEAWVRLLIRATEARLGSFPIYHAVGIGGLRGQRERLMDILGERLPGFARPAGARRERVEALLVLMQIEEFTAHVAVNPNLVEMERGVALITAQLLVLAAGPKPKRE
jgi:AcrR family transcriptional regulator